MNHRHLLPNEIDLILDDEVGFGVAPLRAHLGECAECRARVEDARVVVDVLEELPHLAPSFDFGNRVMAQVPVFVPWHVAAREAVTRWVPASRPARVAALAFGTSVTAVLTAGIVWMLTRTDLLLFATGVVGSRIRELVTDGMQSMVVTVFGTQAFDALQRGSAVGLMLASLALLAVAVTAMLGLRAIATASSRQRG